MSSTYRNCSLYLCPDMPDVYATNMPSMITELQKICLISRKIRPQDNNNHFYSGDSFLDYIAYMGCAPAIQLEASADNENFCFIKLHNYEAAELIHSKTQSSAPHCPNCNKPVHDWQTQRTSTTISCDSCHTTSGIEKFDWRRMAGYARLFIEITDIFPKEAVPQPVLLEKLSTITNTGWLYFYSCQ